MTSRRWRNSIYRSLRGEEVPQGSIVRSIGKEGKVIWFGLKAVSFTWDEKPAVWLLMNDITERKMAEDSLRESEKRYRLLAENARMLSGSPI